MRTTLWLSFALLSTAALCLAAGPDCHLDRVGGVPAFIIGGKPHSGVCYSSYDTHPPRLEERARAFGLAGCSIFNFVVELAGYGYSTPMWTGLDQFDFTPLDDRVHTVLRGAPTLCKPCRHRIPRFGSPPARVRSG